MDEILDIDAELTPLSARIAAASQALQFTEICGLHDEAEIARQIYKGIYLIEISTAGVEEAFDSWVFDFQAEWDLPEYKKKFTCTTKKKRISCHAVLEPWMPLYIGKSKAVGKRVLEHVNLPLDARTFALKINNRPNMQQRQFRLKTIQLNVNNYDFIASPLEAHLRDRINPLVGKQ